MAERGTSLRVKPTTLRLGNALVEEFHRHNKKTAGHRFSLLVVDDLGRIQGVAIAGRPVAIGQPNDEVLEVLRVCTFDGSPKGACSMLYAACWRAWKAMGGLRAITYTLQSEDGASLRGAGWRIDKSFDSGARNTSHWTNRPNRKKQDVVQEPKHRWCCP